ncbi:MAG: hypothetical protein ABA06_04240 [Parcubacteria bacterium C7867-001]|nr:MAG: hypothetical protein ABA06_04240 [Parcubacteria bacterium C7867-001]
MSSGHGRDGRRVTLWGDGQSVTYLEVSEEEARGTGFFVMAVGFIAFLFAICASTALTHGHWPLKVSPFDEALNGGFIFLGLLLFVLGLRSNAQRGFIPALCYMLVLSAAISHGAGILPHSMSDSEATKKILILFGLGTVAFPAGVVWLYPYPHKIGLAVVWMMSMTAQLLIIISWAETDTGTFLGISADWVRIVFAGFIGLGISLYGAGYLSHLHRMQHDAWSNWFIRHGD